MRICESQAEVQVPCTARPSVSVALCTFNGAEYLPQMLDSLLTQRFAPAELVVCDDASEDSSPAILEQFAALAPFPVRLVRNPVRLGVSGNFAHAIRLCGCEIVALADQDDVWLPDKLEALARAFRDPSCSGAFSDAQVVNESLTPLGYTMWQRVRFSAYEQDAMNDGDALSVLLKHWVVTGATMAFRTDLRTMALPIPFEWSHDAWIALIAGATGRVVPIAQPLVLYRQHPGNVVGGKWKTTFDQAATALRLDRSAWYREEILRWQQLRERLIYAGLPERPVALVSSKLRHLQTRADLPGSRLLRIPAVLRELAGGRYRRYARNWGSIAIDLLVR